MSTPSTAAAVRHLRPTDWPSRLGRLRQGWALALEADDRSPLTIRNYLYGLDAFLAILADEGQDPDPETWDRLTADLFKTALQRRGLSANTRRVRWVAVQAFIHY